VPGPGPASSAATIAASLATSLGVLPFLLAARQGRVHAARRVIRVGCRFTVQGLGFGV